MTGIRDIKHYISATNRSFFITLSLLCSHVLADPKTVIDVMFLYNAGVERATGGDVQALIDHRVAVTNKIYADSGLNVAIRSVHAKKVSTSDTETSVSVLKRLTSNLGEFASISEERKKHGADMVTMLRPYALDRSCGVAWIGGYGTRGNMAGFKNYMYSHVSITACGSHVLAHELGHNMGLHHSRRQAPQGGTWPHSTGYGVNGQFVTVMAYPSSFSARTLNTFSSPLLMCKGTPCGVSTHNPTQGADAVYTIKQTAPQIAAYLPSIQTASSEKSKNTGSVSTQGMKKLFEYRDLRAVYRQDLPVDTTAWIPPGTQRVIVQATGGNGDCDLYAHHRGWPSPSHNSHQSVTAKTTNETLVIQQPARAYMFSLFAGNPGCEGVTMRAYYD